MKISELIYDKSPTAEPLALSNIQMTSELLEFSRWIDGDLEQLEVRFHAYRTRNSVKHSLSR